MTPNKSAANSDRQQQKVMQAETHVNLMLPNFPPTQPSLTQVVLIRICGQTSSSSFLDSNLISLASGK